VTYPKVPAPDVSGSPEESRCSALQNDTHKRYMSNEKVQAMHMPKSTIRISDDGPLVRKRMFSKLFTAHGLDSKSSPRSGGK